MRFSPIVLPVVSIYAECFIMLGEIERTPDSFEMEHVEIVIVLEIVDEIDGYVMLIVSKGTESPILTELKTVRVVAAEFRLVFLWLVELLDAVVRFETKIPIRAIFRVFGILAEVSGVEIAWTFAVFQVVVKRTLLMVVLGVMSTGLQFEVREFQVFNGISIQCVYLQTAKALSGLSIDR